VFARLGSFAVRRRWPIIAAWVVVAVALTLVAPNIDDVAVSDQRAFLPSTAPSLEASELMKRYFPDRFSPSSAVIVVEASDGSRLYQEDGDAGAAAPGGAMTNTSDSDRAPATTLSPAARFVADLTDWLSGPQAPAGVDRVLSPTSGDEQTRASLVSPDGQVALLLVRFAKVGTEPQTKEAMAAIRAHLQQAPAGVTVYMTGDGPILAAYGSSSKGSVDSTTWITITLVVVILLIIYRSPVSPFIPLLTISLAYAISRAVVALLGTGPLTISMYTNVFLIVVLFGAGTDYCLFLISRFREEMADAPSPAPAVRTTVRSVGETIASSAGTVIVGLAMMTFAELGLYNTTGPAIAIGVAIALLAGLTLTPALLAILGERAFWPRKARHLHEAGYWHAWAARVVRRPLVALLVPVVVLVPLAVYGSGLVRDFDLLGDLPKNDETRRGFDVLAAHFGPGQMQPLNVVAVDPGRLDTPQGLARTSRLAERLAALPHVKLVRSFTASLPDPATLRVADQLGVQISAVREAAEALKQGLLTGLGPRPELQKAAAGLLDLYGYLSQLVQGYPEIATDSGFRQAMTALSELARLAQEMGLGPTSGIGSAASSAEDSPLAASDIVTAAQEVLRRLDSLTAGLEALQTAFAGRPEAILLPDLYLKHNEGLRALRDAYFSTDGAAARLQVILDTGPYTPQALSTVQAIRQAMAESGLQGGVEGNSSVLLDLREASDRDLTRAYVFVLAGVLVVLVLLLRALVAPLYLILTILLSYSATLGVTRLLFVDALGAEGITWWVPLFMFVMLVALGMDYNIFLIGRVKEEVAGNGISEGTRMALARTGGIITSAGIIMAGTFASMMSSRLLGLLQIGFAVAFGVLLDTFVVRTTLVPALTVLLGRWAWWPRRKPGGNPGGENAQS
jgi:RND superfamily putative drug exporter